MNAPAIPLAVDLLDKLALVPTAKATTARDIDVLADAGEPVLLKGIIDHWPALAAASHSPQALNLYLRQRDTGAPVPVMEAPPSSGGKFGYSTDVREFTFTKRSRPLGETLERIEKSSEGDGTLAIQMLPLDTQLPVFLRENPMPLVPATARPKLWLGGPVKTQIHNDRDHNLACVIAGCRRFVLFPPEQVTNLYIGPLDNPPALSLVDPEAPQFEQFPRFGKALDEARVARLGPGDALLIPRYWWHHVTSIGPYNAMVNYWWGDAAPGLGNPHDLFLFALLALKDLPDREKSYWRAMFETHIYGDDGAAHISPQARGILGTLTPQLRALLKQRLKAAIIKS